MLQTGGLCAFLHMLQNANRPGSLDKMRSVVVELSSLLVGFLVRTSIDHIPLCTKLNPVERSTNTSHSTNTTLGAPPKISNILASDHTCQQNSQQWPERELQTSMQDTESFELQSHRFDAKKFFGHESRGSRRTQRWQLPGPPRCASCCTSRGGSSKAAS